MTTATEPTPTSSEEARRYQREKQRLEIVGLVLSLLTLIVAGLMVGPTVGKQVSGWVGPSPWLRLAALAFVYGAAMELLSLPLDFWSSFVLEHRYQLSTQTLRGWIWKRLKGYLIGGPFGLVLLFGLYGLIWSLGSAWWVAAAVGWLLLTLVLGRILPVLILPLFYKVTRLDDTGLLERLRQLAAGTGLQVEGIYRLHLSAETRKANAALAGLGRGRRVLLSDTLLEHFSPEEIEVVFAHEVGHHVHRHLAWTILSGVMLTALSLWLADLTLRTSATALGYPPDYDPATLPLLLLVLGVFGLMMLPAQNAVSRAFERQADGYALERTARPEAFRSAFLRLAEMNKADLDPNPWVVWLLHDHPPIRERLALAERR
jgi:STE24 endopeptidase